MFMADQRTWPWPFRDIAISKPRIANYSLDTFISDDLVSDLKDESSHSWQISWLLAAQNWSSRHWGTWAGELPMFRVGDLTKVNYYSLFIGPTLSPAGELPIVRVRGLTNVIRHSLFCIFSTIHRLLHCSSAPARLLEWLEPQRETFLESTQASVFSTICNMIL